MRLRVSIVASIIALLLGAFSIGGATMAWFTAGSDTMENTFTAGTVSFLLNGPYTSTEEDGCLPVNWQIDYTGSKKAYLRVRSVVEAEEVETIYIAIHAILQNGNRSRWAREPGSDSFYFAYTLNSSKTVFFQQGNEQVQGNVTISNDNGYLNFSFNFTDSNSTLSQFDIYVGLIPPANDDYTTYDYRVLLPTPDQKVYLYQIPLDQIIGSGGSVDVQLCDPGNPWVMGNDDWWYYNGVVNPGAQIGVCFKFCVGSGYNGDISYYLEAEAVQASHGAIDVLWPNRNWAPPGQP
jgi:predicted ribosomally synthesized peptide with SipW-like signal peptide